MRRTNEAAIAVRTCRAERLLLNDGNIGATLLEIISTGGANDTTANNDNRL